MGIFGYTRKVPAGITGTTNKPERKTMSTKKAKKSKYPAPAKPVPFSRKPDLAKLTKDALVQYAMQAENSIIGHRDTIAELQTRIAIQKVDLKLAKAKIKSLKTTGAK